MLARERLEIVITAKRAKTDTIKNLIMWLIVVIPIFPDVLQCQSMLYTHFLHPNEYTDVLLIQSYCGGH